jgi:flagellar FliL protein
VRFLKVDLDAVAGNPLAIEEIKKHMPAVRNAIVMLLSGQQYEVLVTPEGKETLRGQVLAEVQRVLEAQTGEKVVDDIYFTSFVMQ